MNFNITNFTASRPKKIETDRHTLSSYGLLTACQQNPSATLLDEYLNEMVKTFKPIPPYMYVRSVYAAAVLVCIYDMYVKQLFFFFSVIM